MPLLANLLLLLFGALTKFLAAIFAFRLAFALTYIGLFTAGAVGLYNTLVMLAQSLAPEVPPNLAVMASWVIPHNFLLCISALISAEIAKVGFNMLDYMQRIILGKA